MYPSTLAPEKVQGCLEYRLSVMTPRMIPSSGVRNPYLDAWLPASMHSPMLFSALLFSSLTHKRMRSLVRREQGLYGSAVDDSFLHFCQQEARLRVNAALRQHDSAVADATILSVAMMIETADVPEGRDWTAESPLTPPLQGLQWLNIHGARLPNMEHQAGLCKLVKLKGGLQNIKIPGAASAIFYRALVNSTLTLSQPQLPFFSVYGHGIFDLAFNFNCDPLQFENGTLEFAQMGLPPELAYAFHGMKMYSFVIQEYIEGGIGVSDSRMMCDLRNLVHFHVLTLPPANESDTNHRGPLYEACRISALIYSTGVLFPMPAVGSPHGRLATLLQQELADTDLLDAPPTGDNQNLFVWILAMGSIAASNGPERRWFVQKLVELSCHMSMSHWNRLKTILKSILWLDCACDRAAIDTRAGHNHVSTAVDGESNATNEPHVRTVSSTVWPALMMPPAAGYRPEVNYW
ncbi:uncharacterized protein DSM5745_01931 [Aspergillus mulundensis]|uniref:Transcription factor domain-containing protein n=1 Tax=Aspergillus mulundensis TaxID=1810919 RepID=A0A3D8SV41_9EURO|nr:hypothetical protein DSM5745_01931 [Aspergillus mulundensis]RDW90156.1 hypothetical protein DSM5745_01931 [Aspergillus mulundensis]